jgi:cardiolipin synthase
MTNRRKLGPAEAVIMLWSGAILALFSVVAFIWPKAIAYPLVVFCMWLALSLLVRGFKLRRRRG